MRRCVGGIAAAIVMTFVVGAFAPAVHPGLGGVAAASVPAPAPVESVRLNAPAVFIVADESLPRAVLERVTKTDGVAAAESVDAAEVMLSGKKVGVLGVDPDRFRAFTPKATAESDGLWANVTAGDVAVGFVLGKAGGMPLGSRVAAADGRSLRIGAYATVGIDGIDAVVSRDTGRGLSLPQGNAIVVSPAKDASGDVPKLADRLRRDLPKDVRVSEVGGSAVPERRGPGMTSQQIDRMLKTASSRQGAPYVWGAEGPGSFDCSGLVQWAFARAGVRMPRVAHQQWRAGQRLPYGQAKPGDLLFWTNDPTNPGYISHVAIYLGGGRMLHAPHSGDVVRVANVYTKNMAGAVRVVPETAARVR